MFWRLSASDVKEIRKPTDESDHFQVNGDDTHGEDGGHNEDIIKLYIYIDCAFYNNVTKIR